MSSPPFPYLWDWELAEIDRLERVSRGRYDGWVIDGAGRYAVDVRRDDDRRRFTGRSLMQALRLAREAVEAGRA